jgi:hypothetical protein
MQSPRLIAICDRQIAFVVTTWKARPAGPLVRPSPRVLIGRSPCLETQKIIESTTQAAQRGTLPQRLSIGDTALKSSEPDYEPYCNLGIG